MQPIHAVFENGVFRPQSPVDLPENCHVVFEPQIVEQDATSATLDDIYAVLSKRFASGEHDVAARHNEHQP
jgi:predicted DNA-binding antitoxin AbrB/MazE fold protein